MSFDSSVWDRRGSDSMSKNLFMLMYGTFTFIGLGVTAFAAFLTQGWFQPEHGYVGPIPFLVLVIGVLLSGIFGVFIALSSDIPVVSFIGYMMIAAPFGMILGPTVAMYTAASVAKVVFVTFLLTAVLTVIGACIPESLSSFGGWLFSALIFVLLAQFGIPLMGWLIPSFPLAGALTLLDWFAAAVFSIYIVYDVNQALRVPATLDNAIDCSVALYLDIINLFIRLLQIMGESKNND